MRPESTTQEQEMLQEITSELKEAAEYSREKQHYYDYHKQEIKRVARELNLGNALIRANCTATSVDLSVTGNYAVLKDVFHGLRKLGYEPKERPTKEKTATFSTYFTNEVTELRIWMSFSSTVCTRKKIGTKMQEVPVYETVCE